MLWFDTLFRFYVVNEPVIIGRWKSQLCYTNYSQLFHCIINNIFSQTTQTEQGKG